MKAAQENRYFVDGFFIKHFKMFPVGVNPETFFEEQRIFVCYLMGNIQDMPDWRHQCSYIKKKNDIDTMTIDDIQLTDNEKELAKMQNESEIKKKKEKLKFEKINLKKQLNDEFGIKEEKSTQEIVEKAKTPGDEQKLQLWDMLQAKGIVKNG
ncbi:MAG: hypothetical protein WC900_05035 [Oscillospiraceae bacterium]